MATYKIDIVTDGAVIAEAHRYQLPPALNTAWDMVRAVLAGVGRLDSTLAKTLAARIDRLEGTMRDGASGFDLKVLSSGQTVRFRRLS